MDIASYLLDHGARVNAESKANIRFLFTVYCTFSMKLYVSQHVVLKSAPKHVNYLFTADVVHFVYAARVVL